MDTQLAEIVATRFLEGQHANAVVWVVVAVAVNHVTRSSAGCFF